MDRMTAFIFGGTVFIIIGGLPISYGQKRYGNDSIANRLSPITFTYPPKFLSR